MWASPPGAAGGGGLSREYSLCAKLIDLWDSVCLWSVLLAALDSSLGVNQLWVK